MWWSCHCSSLANTWKKNTKLCQDVFTFFTDPMVTIVKNVPVWTSAKQLSRVQDCGGNEVLVTLKEKRSGLSALDLAKWAGRQCTLLFLSALSQPTCALKIEDKALVRRRWRAARGPGECHTSLDRTTKLENGTPFGGIVGERGFLPSGFWCRLYPSRMVLQM